MVNGALAVFLLGFITPVVSRFGGKPGYVQVALGALIALVLLVVVLCLSSALRPGSLGRLVRRVRSRRAG